MMRVATRQACRWISASDQAGDRAQGSNPVACKAGLPRGVALMDAAYALTRGCVLA